MDPRSPCFHGKRLQYADAFTIDEAADLLTLMRDEDGTEATAMLAPLQRKAEAEKATRHKPTK
nr:hypothetical protein [Streptomyces sp. CS131]